MIHEPPKIEVIEEPPKIKKDVTFHEVMIAKALSVPKPKEPESKVKK